MKIREMNRDEVQDVWSIDRSEIVHNVYYHVDGDLVLKPEYYDMKGWPSGEPELYNPMMLDCYDHGGTFYGAYDNNRLVGVAILEGRFIGSDQDQLQLKFLHVSRNYRKAGLGRTLFDKAVARAVELGAKKLYISSTPSENTVNFYLNLGCRVTDDLDPDLFKLEPEDIHLEYEIRVRVEERWDEDVPVER